MFGVLLESQAISQFQFENGMKGLLTTSAADDYPSTTRIEGTGGMIEVALRTAHLRVWAKGSPEWEVVELQVDTSLGDKGR